MDERLWNVIMGRCYSLGKKCGALICEKVVEFRERQEERRGREVKRSGRCDGGESEAGKMELLTDYATQ